MESNPSSCAARTVLVNAYLVLPVRLAAFAIVLTLATSARTQASGGALIVPMKELNGSTQKGTATFTQLNDGVRVEVKLQNAAGTLEPTHFHFGMCAKIVRSVEYALLDAKDGSSVTMVHGVTIEQLREKHYALNVHKSLKELDTYVSCGDIR